MPPLREVDIVPDLVMSGALPHLDNLHVDWSFDPLLSHEEKEVIQELHSAMEVPNTKHANKVNLSGHPQDCKRASTYQYD